jgi:protoporphyrinogen/coproporphyrinogen III oxidase
VSVAVVGAGACGLAVAVGLRARGIDVTVFEAAERPGGVVRTAAVDGALVEQGPQSLRSAGGAPARLIEALGLQARVVAPSPDARRRFLLIGGRLRALPTGPLGLLSGGALGVAAALRALAEPLIPARRALPGPDVAPESVDAFVGRRFGRGVADPLVDAFIAGIYAGDARRTEAASAFPDLVAAERDAGSVILGMLRRPKVPRPAWMPPVTFTFRSGVQELTDAAAASLGSSLRLLTAVERIEVGERQVRVFVGGEPILFDDVVIAAPPAVAARLLPAIAGQLAVPSAPVAAVHLGWSAGDGPPQRGFGWLAPSRERTDVLGAIWVSRTFPHLAPGRDLVRVMVGGARAPELAGRSPAALAAHALAVIRAVQGDVPDPTLVQVAVHQPGIPQYVVGHAERVRSILAYHPRVHVLGWGYTGIGLSQGFAAAESLAGAIADRRGASGAA